MVCTPLRGIRERRDREECTENENRNASERNEVQRYPSRMRGGASFGLRTGGLRVGFDGARSRRRAGDSIFVDFPEGGTMLVDAGTAEAGPRVVETLRSLDAGKIDILVATHPHSDHIGGMLAVLDAFPVGKVWDSGYVHGTRTQQLFLQTVLDRKIRFGRPKAGFRRSFRACSLKCWRP